MEWVREKAFVLEVDLFLLISLHGDYPLKGKNEVGSGVGVDILLWVSVAGSPRA